MSGLESCLSGDRRGRWIILCSPARLEVLLLLVYAEPTNDSWLLGRSLYSVEFIEVELVEEFVVEFVVELGADFFFVLTE